MEGKTLSEKLDDLNQRQKTIGMGAAAARAGKTEFTYYYGMQNCEKRIPVSENTIFRAASVSKHISAMVVMCLCDKGLCELDEDIGKYLGYSCRNPYYSEDKITLRHLMTHTSTYIESGSYNRICVGEMPPYRLSQVLQTGSPGYTRENYLKCHPGEQYAYSSFGSGIMGAVAECVSGKKFADLADEMIFAPLGIMGGYDPRTMRYAENIAGSYEPTDVVSENEKLARQLTVQQEWLKKSLENKLRLADLPVGEAYRMAQGNAHIRPVDVMEIQYVLMHGGLAKNGKRILSEESAREMQKVQFEEKAGGSSERNFRFDAESRGQVYRGGEGICTGLNLLHFSHILDGRELIGHFGRAYGVLTCTLFEPKTQTGVCIMTNGTDPAMDAHGYTYTLTETCRYIYLGLGF